MEHVRAIRDAMDQNHQGTKLSAAIRGLGHTYLNAQCPLFREPSFLACPVKLIDERATLLVNMYILAYYKIFVKQQQKSPIKWGFFAVA